jgi:hypothetical protein
MHYFDALAIVKSIIYIIKLYFSFKQRERTEDQLYSSCVYIFACLPYNLDKTMTFEYTR